MKFRVEGTSNHFGNDICPCKECNKIEMNCFNNYSKQFEDIYFYVIEINSLEDLILFQNMVK